jgi:hypothetical protein
MSDEITTWLQCLISERLRKQLVTADWNLVYFTCISSPLSPQSEVSGIEYYMTHSSTFRSCFIEDGLLARLFSIEIRFDWIQKLQANNCPSIELLALSILSKCAVGWCLVGLLVDWFTADILHICRVSCSNNDPKCDYHELSPFLCCQFH